MPRRDSEQEDYAPQQPSFSTLKKASRNNGAGHADLDADGTVSESDADVEKDFVSYTKLS
jgi:hypothetical protein